MTTSERPVSHEGGPRSRDLDLDLGLGLGLGLDRAARAASYVVRIDGWPIGTFHQCLGLPDDATFGYGLAGTVCLSRACGIDSEVLAAWVTSSSGPTNSTATITAYDARGVALRAWRLRDAWPLRHRVWAAAEQLLVAHTGVLRSLP